MTASKPVFQWEDPFFLDAQLNDEERMVRDAAKAFADDVLKPRVISDFREESFDPAVMKEMGAIGLLGPTIPETYGGAGLNHVCYGLAAREIERIDSGYRSAMSVNHPWSCTRSTALAATSKSRNICQNLPAVNWLAVLA